MLNFNLSSKAFKKECFSEINFYSYYQRLFNLGKYLAVNFNERAKAFFLKLSSGLNAKA